MISETKIWAVQKVYISKGMYLNSEADKMLSKQLYLVGGMQRGDIYEPFRVLTTIWSMDAGGK